ncbi:hypothetical protein Dda_0283 [Drechslerella dactyloides]|uniref:Uncharacterized protein n=1 Tax=Drechslerella dactyloides TaxID=74499 RepID=A0AAD6J4W0_DREDA|nr:hypothetical protein Dda_0283 [Drechslerella dactyloides]
MGSGEIAGSGGRDFEAVPARLRLGSITLTAGDADDAGAEAEMGTGMGIGIAGEMGGRSRVHVGSC